MQRVFKICAFQKCNNSLRHGFLAALYMMIGGTNLIAAAAEVIAKLALHIRFDFRFVVTCAGEKDGRGGGLCALDALLVVVGHLGGEPRQMQRFCHVLRQPCGR